MKRSRENNLIDKFWEGETSSEEEKMIFSEIDSDEDSDYNNAYRKYIFKMRETPDRLEEDIWEAIHIKRKRKIFNLSTISVAASVLILAGVFSVLKYQERQKELEKQFALIEQALNHASSEITDENNQDVLILYEDDLITIVAENN